MKESGKPSILEKTLMMRISFFKAEMRLLLKEIEDDIPQLGSQSSRYHRFFAETLRLRIEKAEKAMDLLRYHEVF